MPSAFDSGLFEGLPPNTAMVMQQSLRRRCIVTVFQLVLGVAVALVGARVLGVFVIPAALIFVVLAILEYRSARRLQRVIRCLVEEPHRVTSALVVSYHAPKTGKSKALEIRLSDNTKVRIIRLFSDEPLLAAADEIRAAMGR